MSSPMTQEQRYIKMTETPISRLIPSLAIPTIISMLVTSIYNMADTFFVSQISTSASALWVSVIPYGHDPGPGIYPRNGKRKLSIESPRKPGYGKSGADCLHGILLRNFCGTSVCADLPAES